MAQYTSSSSKAVFSSMQQDEVGVGEAVRGGGGVRRRKARESKSRYDTITETQDHSTANLVVQRNVQLRGCCRLLSTGGRAVHIYIL
eukprot:scaffold13634_cov123-Skeletonema_dohrnii-CCMP3373.AAC.3